MTKPRHHRLRMIRIRFSSPFIAVFGRRRSLAGTIRWLQQLFGQEGGRYRGQRHPGLFSADTEESRHFLQAGWWLGSLSLRDSPLVNEIRLEHQCRAELTWFCFDAWIEIYDIQMAAFNRHSFTPALACKASPK